MNLRIIIHKWPYKCQTKFHLNAYIDVHMNVHLNDVTFKMGYIPALKNVHS